MKATVFNYDRNAHKVKCHPSLQKGGCYEVHDIEDLVKVGQSVKGLLPFPLTITDFNTVPLSINIEDVASDAGSIEVEEDVLFGKPVCTYFAKMSFLILLTCNQDQVLSIAQGIISWIGDRKMSMKKHEFEHYSSL
ncbi:hypothetical protein GW17_00009298 [Ensete ventricosum]|nr:hypothetical protein GW17_00009298 [Ensete ventricosum]